MQVIHPLQVCVWKVVNADRQGGVCWGSAAERTVVGLRRDAPCSWGRMQAGHDTPSPLCIPISAWRGRQAEEGMG